MPEVQKPHKLLLGRIVVGLAFFGTTVPMQSAPFWQCLIGVGCGVFLALLALALLNDPLLEGKRSDA